jgi:hypothetical protein
MPVDPAAWLTALVFGAVLGWVLGRRDSERTVARTAALVTAGAGCLVWLTGPAIGSETAMAAVSMTLGGATLAAAIHVTGRSATA